MSNSNWTVFRQDFTGNVFVVEQNLSEERARELVTEFESHKHHQHYWAGVQPKTQVDYAAMLRTLLLAGSSLDVSLKVLRNQDATVKQCVQAIKETRDLGVPEAIHVVLSSTAFSDQGGMGPEQMKKLEQELAEP